MPARRSLPLAAAAATAVTLAAFPQVASAAPAPAHGHVHPHHASVRSALDDPPVDAKVTTSITGLPDSFTAGDDPTPLTVTYTNTGTTSYALSALTLDVYDLDAAPAKVTPTAFTVSFTYPGGTATSPAAGDCAQQTPTDNTYTQVSCYLDPGDDAAVALAPGASVSVQVNLSFAATFTTQDAQLGASAVLYATDDDNAPEVDGADYSSAEFSVDADNGTAAHPLLPAARGRLAVPLPGLTG